MAAPAYARDGAGYVGIEGGIMWPKDNDGNAFVDYTSSTTAAAVGEVSVGPVRFRSTPSMKICSASSMTRLRYRHDRRL